MIFLYSEKNNHLILFLYLVNFCLDSLNGVPYVLIQSLDLLFLISRLETGIRYFCITITIIGLQHLLHNLFQCSKIYDKNKEMHVKLQTDFVLCFYGKIAAISLTFVKC